MHAYSTTESHFNLFTFSLICCSGHSSWSSTVLWCWGNGGAPAISGVGSGVWTGCQLFSEREKVNAGNVRGELTTEFLTVAFGSYEPFHVLGLMASFLHRVYWLWCMCRCISTLFVSSSTDDASLDFGEDNSLFTPHTLHLLVTNTTAITAHLTTCVQHFPPSTTHPPLDHHPTPQKRWRDCTSTYIYV